MYTLHHLQTWREATAQVNPPIRLGVFGDPVEHSLSPEIQNAALRQAGLAIQYASFHIRATELSDALRLARENNFIGVNLTHPHKVAAVELVAQCDELARNIGAINTVFQSGGEFIGFNTDASGFSRALREAFSVDLRDLRVLLLGAGGAARAIAFQCALENCERLAIANRDPVRAAELVEGLRPHFSGPRVLGPVARLEAVPLRESLLRFQIANSDLVVNATSRGSSAHDSAILGPHLLAPHLFVFDVVYRAGKTPLVRAAEEAGARACDGRGMLLHQGAAAFEIWFSCPAPLEAMRAAL
jgi:shikimate dehydrogenase